jgi:hypothetical protein
MKGFLKFVWKRITCKHDYWWYAEATWSNPWGLLDYEQKVITCTCKKCGKEKSLKFKKSVDKES